ncbi:MAG: hypothetical protein ACUVYA_08520 [Planctomycetota bacterium]
MIIVPVARDRPARGSRPPTAFALAAASLVAAALGALLAVVASSEAPLERREAEIAYGPEGAKEVKLAAILPRGYDAKRTYPVVLALPPGDGSAEMAKAALEKAGARCRVDVRKGEGHFLKLRPKELLDWIERSMPEKK